MRKDSLHRLKQLDGDCGLLGYGIKTGIVLLECSLRIS